MLGAHNRVVALRNAIVVAWPPLDDLLQRRDRSLTGLVEALQARLGSEQATLDASRAAQRKLCDCLDAVRPKPARADTLAGLAAADTALGPLLTRVLSLVDNDARLKSDPAVAMHAHALREIEPRLAFARQAFNAACATYDAAVRQFPTRMLSPLLGFVEAGRL
jgi:LemA protein